MSGIFGKGMTRAIPQITRTAASSKKTVLFILIKVKPFILVLGPGVKHPP
jgi:hypothetical protein